VAIVAATPLWPLHQKKRIQRITMSTYQAASGAGAAAMEELSESTKAFLEGRSFTPKVLPHPYAFNVFSHNTKVDPETGYNEEETKVMQETRKIFGEPNLRVTATCVRVPVLRAHCIALNIEFEQAMSVAEAREILASAPGVRVVDELERNYFPMPVDASGKDEILVGRLRKDVSDPSGKTLALFVAGDQLRKGAALNAVQIAERLLG
jgi:aspartate-semialdehyde dehydrogenase